MRISGGPGAAGRGDQEADGVALWVKDAMGR